MRVISFQGLSKVYASGLQALKAVDLEIHRGEILALLGPNGLDEPTAGVDVELRRDMWALVRRLREGGVTIILTTHYIDEAEEMADRSGVIDKGALVVVDEKAALMRSWRLALNGGGTELEDIFVSLVEKRA